MAIPLEWKASITGVGDVKSKLAELNQEYKTGQITLEEYSQKKNFLTRVTRSAITTLSQERNILLATHPALQTVSRAMSTFGRVTSSALSIMNAFNLAQLVTQGQTQPQFDIKLKIIGVDQELVLLQAALKADPDNEELQILVRLKLAERDELINQSDALGKEISEQWWSNLVTTGAGFGTAIATTFTALTSNPKVFNAIVGASKWAAGHFAGLFQAFSTTIMVAGTWIKNALMDAGLLTRYTAAGTVAGTKYGTGFLIGVGIGIGLAAGAVFDLIQEKLFGTSTYEKLFGKSASDILGVDIDTPDTNIHRTGGIDMPITGSGGTTTTKGGKTSIVQDSKEPLEQEQKSWTEFFNFLTVKGPEAYTVNATASQTSMDAQVATTQSGVDIITNGYNTLSKGVIGSINNMITQYNRIARKTKQSTLGEATNFTIPATTLGGKRSATGFEGITNGMTSFIAGEAGREHVKITPLGSNTGSGKGQVINQYITVQGSILAERDVERIANNGLKRDLKRVGF